MRSSENAVDEIAAETEEKVAQSAEAGDPAEVSAERADESSEKENGGEKQNENSVAVLADEQKESVEQVVHADEDESFAGNYEAMLTTIDNPFDPFEKFDDWFRFDEENGYHSCAYLGRIAEISDEMSEEEFAKEIERAIDEILKYDVFNVYKKVRRPMEVSEIPAETVEFDD